MPFPVPQRLGQLLAGLFLFVMSAACGDEGRPSENTTTSSIDGATSPTMTSPPATLDERESPYDFEVVASPPIATVGTAIMITAPGCDDAEEVGFADRRTVDAGASAPGRSVPFRESGQTLTAEFTISPEDSIGGAVVTVRYSNGEGATSVEVVRGK